MKQPLEAWEWDMLVAGDWPGDAPYGPGDPEFQSHAARLAHEEGALRAALFRAPCPEPLLLAEWSAGLLAANRSAEMAAHVARCPLCQEEVEELRAALDAPLRPLEPSPRARLRRLLLSLQAVVAPGLAQPLPAMRGSSWNASYLGDEFSLVLSGKQQASHHTLRGVLLPNLDEEAAVSLRQGGQPRYQATLLAGSSFALGTVEPGCYELVISAAATELVISELVLGA